MFPERRIKFSIPESPHHEIQIFSSVVVCIMVKLQLQLTDTTWRQNRIVHWSSEFFSPFICLTNIRELRKLLCKPSLANSYQLNIFVYTSAWLNPFRGFRMIWSRRLYQKSSRLWLIVKKIARGGGRTLAWKFKTFSPQINNQII
jgi:hypothetical protein